MNGVLRIAINNMIESINRIDDVISYTEYNGNTTLPVKKAIEELVTDIVSQDAELKKEKVMYEGYVDDVKRVRIALGLASETERKA
ncbi:hypothetical protein [Methanosphaera sp.]